MCHCIELPGYVPLIHLCRQFDAAAVVDVLKVSSSLDVEANGSQGRPLVRELFQWLEARSKDILGNSSDKSGIG